MTNICDSLYGVSCDQCTPDLVCRIYLPGIAGFCYQYASPIASFVQKLLPTASGVYGLSLAAKKMLPAWESTESWCEYASKMKSSFQSSIGSAFIKAKEAVAANPNETRCQQIKRFATQTFQFVRENPGKMVAVAASVIIPQLVPVMAQMPAITGLALGALTTVKYGNKLTAFLKDLVTQRPVETNEAFKKRLCRTGYKVLVALTILAGLGVGAGILIPDIIQRSTTYNIWLPLQTHTDAFIEYCPLVIAHALLALRDGTNGKKMLNKLNAVFHTLNSMSSLAFPLYIVGTGQDLRLHHFWIGQFFQTLPASSAKLFGLFLSVDGWVQIVTPTGYENYDYGASTDSSYGCDNVVMDNFNNILYAGSLALLLDGTSKILFSQTNLEDLSVWQSLKSLARKLCGRRSTEPSESSRLLDAAYSNNAEPVDISITVA